MFARCGARGVAQRLLSPRSGVLRAPRSAPTVASRPCAASSSGAALRGSRFAERARTVNQRRRTLCSEEAGDVASEAVPMPSGEQLRII